MAKRVQPWWIVVVNLGGISGPIKCYKRDEDDEAVLWDKDGDYDCDCRVGVWPLSKWSLECTKFQSSSRQEAEIFAAGARAIARVMLTYTEGVALHPPIKQD